MITANKLYLPAWLARLCLRATLEKGVGHKYVRREPTGDPRKPWRYYYNLTSGRGHLDTSKIRDGAKFKIADGHVHITKLDGEHAEVVHDETGETARMHVHDLADLIQSHHGEEIERVAQRQQKFDLRRRQRVAERKSRRAMSLPRSDRAISSAIENEIGHDFGTIDMDDQRVRDKIESIFPKSRANKIRHFHDLVSELVKQARKNNEVRTWADLRDARLGGRLAGTDTIFDVIREIGDEIDDEQLKRATIPAEAQDEILRREEEQHYRDQYGDDEEGDAREPEDGDTSFDPEMFKSFRIPGWLAKALEHVVEKAAGHKYLRRISTGNPKRPWRYYYRVTGGKHLAHDDEIVTGSAFRAKDGDKEGHFHVVGVDGDNVTVRHDETGREATMKREALRAMLHAEHIEKINAAVKWATETRDAAEKHGSEKQKARARKHAEGVVGAFVKPEPKPEPAPAADDAKAAREALYQAGRELENASPNMRDFYVKPSGGQPEFKRAVEQHNAWQRAIKDLRGALAKGEKVTSEMLASATKARDQIQAMIAHANEAIRAKKAREIPNDVPNPAGAEIPTFHMNGTPASRVVEGLTPALEALSRAIDGVKPAEAAPELAPEKPAAKERKPRAKAEKATVTDAPKVQDLDGKLTAVGEHVWGSRKDLASVGRIESSKDLETMSYADAAAIVTKARILEPLTLEQAKGLGMSPGVAHMGLAMLAAIRAKPDDSKAGRAAFVDDVRAVQGMLKSVKTLDEFNSAVSEMRYAQRRAKDYTIVEKVADSTYGLDRDAAFARAKELTKQTGEKHEVRSGFGVGVVITKNAPRPFDSLGRTFGAFISGNRDSKVWGDAYTQALTLDNKWDRGAGMTPDQAWAWLEASNKADAKPAEKKPEKSKAGETKRGWSGAKDFAGEVGRRGGKVTVEGADAKRTAETFGLREIDYGRDGYMTQADREYHTKALEEALHDFSEILGVDPKNLSFKGRLGIALGADGKGGRAKAHYETGRRQINITKFRGGGTLAHEWGHAMDNIIAGHYIENTKGSADGAFLSDSPDHPKLPSDVREAISDVMQAILKHPDPAKARAQHAARSKELRKVHEDLVSKNNALVSEHNKIAQMPDSPKAAEARIARLESSIAWHEKEKASEEAKLARAEERTNSASTIERQRALLTASAADSAVRAYTSNIQRFKAEIERLRRGEGIRTPEQSARMAAIEKEVDALRPEINRAGKALKAHDTSDPLVSDYAHAGMLLGADYWGSDRELFARAFESYVQDQLADAKRANTYLVAGTTVQYPTNIPHPNGGDAQPYPQGEERKRINDAMHVLVRVIHQGKHIEKALDALEKGHQDMITVRIPAHLGALLWKAQSDALEKGAGHKYLRRVPTGNSKKPYRYYYRVTGGKLLGHDDEMVVGAAFAVKHGDKAGHFHVKAIDGDKITIEHDESGHRETVTRDGLRAMLHAEHAEAIGTARTRAKAAAEAAEKHGATEKMKTKTASAAKKIEAHFGGKKPTKGAAASKEDEEFDGKYSSDDLKAATAYALERETAELRAKYGSPVRLRNMKAKLDAVRARYKDLPKGVRSALDAIDEAKAMLAVKGKRTTQISVREAVQHVHPEVTRTLEEDFKANEPKAEKKDETKAKKKNAPKAEKLSTEVPEEIRDALTSHLKTLQDTRTELDRYRKLGGRYEAEVAEKREDSVKRANEMVDEFLRLAKKNGVDGEAVIAKLGGRPSTELSPEGAEWLRETKERKIKKALGAEENETMDTIEKSDMLYSGEKLSWWMRRYQGTPFLAEALKLERESMEAMAEVNATMDDGSATERAAATLKRAEVDSTYRKAKDQLAIRYVKWLESQAASTGSVAAEPDPAPGLPTIALPMVKALEADQRPGFIPVPSGDEIARGILRERLGAAVGAELGRHALAVNRAARR